MAPSHIPGVSSDELWEHGADPTAFIDKYGLDRFEQVGKAVYAWAEKNIPLKGLKDSQP